MMRNRTVTARGASCVRERVMTEEEMDWRRLAEAELTHDGALADLELGHLEKRDHEGLLDRVDRS